jgi:hypothetical protein
MIVVILMLSVALLPTGSIVWMDSIQEGYGGSPLSGFPVAGYPAVCYFEDLRNRGFAGADQFPTLVVSLFFLFTSYATRAIKLFENSSVFTRKILRSIPSHFLKRHLDGVEMLQERPRVKLFAFTYYRMLLALIVTLRAVFDLFESMIWEVKSTS